MSEPCRLAFVGDISLGGELADRVTLGSTHWTDPFVDISQIFNDVDLAIGNLEGPLQIGVPNKKKRNVLGAPPESSEALSMLGFTALSLGNNHITDQGIEGVTRTQEILESRGIRHFGAGLTIDEARRPAYSNVRGHSFAFLAYSEDGGDVGTQVATDTAFGCVPFSLEFIERDIRSARKSADHVIISLHWGYQNDRYPSPHQISVARKIIELGALIVFGHHPHVLQGIERHQNGLILYSLGNFFFGDFVRTDGLKFKFPEESRATVAVLCDVSEKGVESFSTLPLRHDEGNRMMVLRGIEAARENQRIKELSEALEGPEFEKLWARHHTRNVRRRVHHERVLKMRSQFSFMREQLREKGFWGSLRRVNGRKIIELARSFGREARLL
jgi:poly-gamma-glutamate synthesis protein (capsule biosynthesis protein)